MSALDASFAAIEALCAALTAEEFKTSNSVLLTVLVFAPLTGAGSGFGGVY